MPWFPHNKYLWDFWFARQDGELHAFYLQAEQAECHFNPDLRHNCSAIGHAVLTPYGWREMAAPALTRNTGRAWDNLSLWTGSIARDPVTEAHYLFYTARQQEDSARWTPSEWQRPQQIGLAVSRDLLTWERVGRTPVIANPGRQIGLDGVAWRDPYVIPDERGGWLAFICARLNPEDRENSQFGTDAGAVIAWLKSASLDNWDCYQTRRLVTSDEFYQMEVPQVFWRRFANGKRFYLIFCAQEKDCSRARRKRVSADQCRTGTYYLTSDLLPFAEQDIPKLTGSARLLTEGWYAGRLLDPETAATPMFFGFQWADEAGRFVGGISDPMPVQFNEDGSISLT